MILGRVRPGSVGGNLFSIFMLTLSTAGIRQRTKFTVRWWQWLCCILGSVRGVSEGSAKLSKAPSLRIADKEEDEEPNPINLYGLLASMAPNPINL
jgi:hypothetical protein